MRVDGLETPNDSDYIELDQLQMPDQLPGEHPSLAFQPLERRVDLTALEYMDLEGEDAISVPEMNYWFTCPEGGWDKRTKRLLKLKEVPWEISNSRNPGEDRTPLSKVEVGKRYKGPICKMMLIHGVLVDIGAENDALIPIGEDAWMDDPGQKAVLWKHFEMGKVVTVKIHKVVDSPYCRFPIIAELVTTSRPLKAAIPPVEDYEPSYDLSGISSMAEAVRITGREMPPTENINQTLGEDYSWLITAMEEDGEITEEDPIDPENPSPRWTVPEYPSDDEFPEQLAEMLTAVAGE